MPEPVDNFLDAIRYYDADDAAMDSKEIQNCLDTARKIGTDWYESALDFVFNRNKTPRKVLADMRNPLSNNQVRTIAETAFLDPKATPLDEVTKPKLEEHTIFSKLKHVSYGVRDLSVTAKYKENNNTFKLRAGDKFGFTFEHQNGLQTHSAGIQYNVNNQTARLNYSLNNPQSYKGISVYMDDKKLGATLEYSSNNGIGLALSGDNHKNIAFSASYNHTYSDAKLSVGAFVSKEQQGLDNYYDRNTNCQVGVVLRITAR